MDPETMFDSAANVGIKTGRIKLITNQKITGKETLVVCRQKLPTAKILALNRLLEEAEAAQSPLFTAEERVNRAVDNFLCAHKLTPEQMQWLPLVREHPVKKPLDGRGRF